MRNGGKSSVEWPNCGQIVRNLVPHYPGEPIVLWYLVSAIFLIVVTGCLARQPKEGFIVVQSLMVPSIIVEQAWQECEEANKLHCVCHQETERWMLLLLYLLSPLCLVQSSSPYDGTSHNRGVFSYLNYTCLEKLTEICLEICILGNFKLASSL